MIGLFRLLFVIGSVAGLFFGTNKIAEMAEKKQFNKGICSKCGGHFKLIEGTKGSLSKGYRCDVCDNCVWISYGSDIEYEYVPSKEAV